MKTKTLLNALAGNVVKVGYYGRVETGLLTEQTGDPTDKAAGAHNYFVNTKRRHGELFGGFTSEEVEAICELRHPRDFDDFNRIREELGDIRIPKARQHLFIETSEWSEFWESRNKDDYFDPKIRTIILKMRSRRTD